MPSKQGKLVNCRECSRLACIHPGFKAECKLDRKQPWYSVLVDHPCDKFRQTKKPEGKRVYNV